MRSPFSGSLFFKSTRLPVGDPLLLVVDAVDELTLASEIFPHGGKDQARQIGEVGFVFFLSQRAALKKLAVAQ